MKETVNVNIGSQAFTLDEDAYRVLRNYLEDIRSRLPEYDTETMGDIEARIAEIFREIVSSPTSANAAAAPRRRNSPNRNPVNCSARARTVRSPASAADWPNSSMPIRPSCA